jgi:hypothetical protein
MAVFLRVAAHILTLHGMQKAICAEDEPSPDVCAPVTMQRNEQTPLMHAKQQTDKSEWTQVNTCSLHTTSACLQHFALANCLYCLCVSQ